MVLPEDPGSILILKHSDTKWDNKKKTVDQNLGGGACCAPPGSITNDYWNIIITFFFIDEWRAEKQKIYKHLA